MVWTIICDEVLILGFATKPRRVGDTDPVEVETPERIADLGGHVVGEDETPPDMAAYLGQFIRINGLPLVVALHVGVGGVQVQDGVGAVPFCNNFFIVLVVHPDTPEFVLEIVHIPDQVGPFF